MSLSILERKKLMDMEWRQREELDALKEIIRKQERQIAILERILRALERSCDDGR